MSDVSRTLSPTTPTLVTPPARPPIMKRFRTPFRLVLTDRDNKTRIFLVETLDGLRSVCARIDSGELSTSGSFGSIEMQLWGTLAEHLGFLTSSQQRPMEAGLSILGPAGAMLDDLSEILGDVDHAVEAVSEFDRLISRKSKQEAPAPAAPPVPAARKPRQLGVVEITDQMVDHLLGQPAIDRGVPQSMVDTAAAAYEEIKNQRSRQPEPVEDYSSLGDVPPTVQPTPQVTEDLPASDSASSSQEAPEAGLDEQGAP